MWLSKFFVFFVVYSFMGWVYESLFVTIHTGKWENRGFLYGPICPIYGVGACAITTIMDLLAMNGISYRWWHVFLIAFLGSIVLEYVTSWVLEKVFHAYWWDYSYMPFNINGRVCLPYSIGFGFGGLIVIYAIAPFTNEKLLGWISPIQFEFFGLVCMAVVAGDVTLTICALSDFERNVIAIEETVNQHMEQFVCSIQEKTQAASNLITEERERFAREHMVKAFKNMDFTYKSAVKRVKGFRPTRIESRKMNAIFEKFRKDL